MRFCKHKNNQEYKKMDMKYVDNALVELDVLRNRIKELNAKSHEIDSVGIKNFTSCMHTDINMIIFYLKVFKYLAM